MTSSLSRLNLDTLVLVESAARHMSFTRAGLERYVTPSAVSQRISKLERQLGFPIFRRGAKSIEGLTPAGYVYVERIRAALELIVEAGITAAAISSRS